jgi:hypothetical protein
MTMIGRPVVPTLLLFALAAVADTAAFAAMYPNPTDDVGLVDTLVVGDFNGDLLPDALLGRYLTAQDLRLALGVGAGTFGVPTTIQTGPRVSRLAVADFNRDGRQDFAALVYDSIFGQVSNTRVEIFRGRGDGTFDPPEVTVIWSTNFGPRDMATADLDGDGAPDLLVETDNGLCRLMNAGNGALNPPVFFGPTGSHLAVADYNEDGRSDVIVAGTGVFILFGTSSGALSNPVNVFPTLFPFNAAAGDVNGDGHADLVYVLYPDQPSASQVSVALGNGAGAFSAPVSYPGYSCCSGLAAADVDGDGRRDLVSVGYGDGSIGGITVLPGLPGGIFGPPRILGGGGDFRSVAFGDLDGDGRVDIAAAIGLGASTSLGGLRSYMGTPDGRFGMKTLGAGAATDVGSADLNGDGHEDLVSVERDNNRVSVLLSHGDGTFDPPLHFPCGPSPQGLTLADFDRDGRIDAVTGLSGSLALLRGNGNGTLMAPVVLPGGGLHTKVVAGDFNRDGWLDVASNNRLDTDVSVFWGIGTGTFEMGRFPAGWRPVDLAAGDVDGDGVQDLVVGTVPWSGGSLPNPAPAQGLGILRGRGDGTFDLPRFLTWTPSTSTVQIADILIADLNGDGIRDLAVANSDVWGDVTVFFGQGLGSFGPHLGLLSNGTTSPISLAAADIDGDGRVDLVVGNYTVAEISVLVADGTGGFLPPSRYGTLTPADLLTGDFNEDGWPDFALTGPDSLASVVLNQGDGEAAHDPVADAGPDRNAGCGAPVVLDGAASSDVDSSPGTNDDIVLFAWFENYGQPSQTALGTGRTLTVPLSPGAHAITLKVTDSTGRTDTDDLLLTVVDSVDTLPPSGSVALSRGTLWPPNHRMVAVTAQVTASDQCGNPFTVTLDSVTSSEPDDAPGGADGSTTGDIADATTGTPDFQFSLRAERSSTGPGRIYTVTYRISDNQGHSSLASGTVHVTHDTNGITDPINLQVSMVYDPDALEQHVVLNWNAISGVSLYDVASGPLSALVHLDPGAGGPPPACIADRLSSSTTSLTVAGDAALGAATFFLVDYVSLADATGGRSGYGSESGPYDLQPVVPVDICP